MSRPLQSVNLAQMPNYSAVRECAIAIIALTHFGRQWPSAAVAEF
jgi:hypothetical protein